jgi:hypothetical protein
MSGSMIVRKQNRYMRRFTEAGAVDPDRAVTPEEAGCRDSWVFRRMVRWGVFVSCGQDRYYLDEEAAAAFRRWRWIKIGPFLLAALIVWLVVQMIVH